MNNSLGQFYTAECISRLLVSKILIKKPKYIIELGAGSGSLLREAQKKWKTSKFIAGEIDSKNLDDLKNEFPNISVFKINGLSSKLNKRIKIKLGTIDVGICNPPYLKVKKSKAIAKIIENSNLGKLEHYKVITSDLVFLAQNLSFIREGGELGIILPDGLLTSHQFRVFREHLINNHQILGVIELPDHVFKKTEAKTHILVIRKARPKEMEVPLYLSDIEGKIIEKHVVNRKDLIFRMDFSYNKWLNSDKVVGIKLSQIGAQVFRGKFSKKQLDNNKYEFLHTTDLNQSFSFMSCKPNKELLKKFKCAQKGDIVISRVGKRCLDRVLMITEGAILISDCLYVIRVDEKYRNAIVDTLTSDYGKKWIEAHSHGVCAKVISKIDLLNLKIQFDEL